MRTVLIAGNWKMHKTLVDARALVAGIIEGMDGIMPKDSSAACEVVVCPPFPLLFPMAKALAGSRILLGAQNAHEEAQGAFTGEVSVPMLKDTGCTHVIIGHSERRHVFGEPPDRLMKKVQAVVQQGLTVIYCVGETLLEHQKEQTHEVVTKQLRDVLNPDIPPERLVVAYEPVWAIGTGHNASPEQAQEVHETIRRKLTKVYGPESAASVRILYGGSVKPGNAGALLGMPDIDGALVGGACLAASDFVAIIRAAIGL